MQVIRLFATCYAILDKNVPSDGSCLTHISGDNLSIILKSQNPADNLSKTYTATSLYVVQEASFVDIIVTYWLKGECNASDIMTKNPACGI